MTASDQARRMAAWGATTPDALAAEIPAPDWCAALAELVEARRWPTYLEQALLDLARYLLVLVAGMQPTPAQPEPDERWWPFGSEEEFYGLGGRQ